MQAPTERVQIGAVDSSNSAPPDNPTPRRGPRTLFLRLGPLLVCLAVFVWVIALTIPRFGGPSGAGYASDFAVFYDAAHLLEHGQNPYDANLLWRSERADFARARLEIPHNRALVRVGNPPAFFWALEPLSHLPFRTAGIVWTAAMYAFSLLGFTLLLRWLGWRRRALAMAIFLAMPQVVIGAFYGDLIGLLFAAIVGGLVLARRYPLLAGVLLSLCWLKPHIALPAVLLIWAFHTPGRIRLGAGFVLGTIVLAALTLAVVGFQGAEQWGSALVGWTGSIKGQPEIASLPGLYYRWAPGALRLALSAGCVACALTMTGWTWHRYRAGLPDPTRIAWLWALWVVCVPYAHINDEMLLAIPLLMLVGRDGGRITSWQPLLALYLLFSCLVANRLPVLPVDLEPIKLVLVLAICWRMSARAERRDAGMASVGVPPTPATVGSHSLTNPLY